MSDFQPPITFEYLAILLWAISGALVGWRKGYDIVGVAVIAFVSAFGGGMLRDGIFLQRLPVVLTNGAYIPLVLLAVAVVVVLGRRVHDDRVLPKIVSVIDALGVPMYAVLGAELALSRGLPTPAVILIAAISGVGGGLMRDLLAGDIPELLRPGQYNTLLVLAAAAFYLALRRTGALPDLLRPWAAILVFFAARLLTIRYNWRTRPLQDFQMRRFVAGVTGWLPGRREP